MVAKKLAFQISQNIKVSSCIILKNIKVNKKVMLYGEVNFQNSCFEEDLKNLELFYKNEGYKDFEIKSKEIVFNNDGIDIYLDIDEGEKILL